MPWVKNNQAEILKAFSSTGEPLVIELAEMDSNGNPIYLGNALQGASESEAKWRIKKISWDVNGNYTGCLFSRPNQIWDNRATLTYT